jgi:secondary thiamine-phosphate synthase enzyme
MELIGKPIRKEVCMISEIEVRTRKRIELMDITSSIRKIVAQSGLREGLCHVFVPHTTAAVTINEKADPAVARDIEATLSKIVPEGAGYRHTEGNADAHVKSSLVGVSLMVPVNGGDVALGTWQAVFFCEFDGPRQRRCLVQLIDLEA